MPLQRCILITLLHVALLGAHRTSADEPTISKRQTKQRAPLRLEFQPDKVIWEGDEPVTGTVVFTNQTRQPIEMLYGGLDGPTGVTASAARVDVDAAGNRVIKCETKSSTAELSCESRLIKIGEIPGADEEAEIEIVEQLIELTVEAPEQITLRPGQSASFSVCLDNYVDEMVLPDGSTARLPGRYEVKLHYESSGDLLWQGEVTSLPVEFEVVPAPPTADTEE